MSSYEKKYLVQVMVGNKMMYFKGFRSGLAEFTDVKQDATPLSLVDTIPFVEWFGDMACIVTPVICDCLDVHLDDEGLEKVLYPRRIDVHQDDIE